MKSLIAEKVKATDGHITDKRLLPMAMAADYSGSARNLCRGGAGGEGGVASAYLSAALADAGGASGADDA